MTERRPRPWEVLSSEPGPEYPMFRVRTDRVRSPKDGSVLEYGIAESPDGVAVVAITEGGDVLLVEQFRHPRREVTLELPSGVMEDGETPEDAARRELREETGYEADEVEVVGTMELNPSWQTARVHVAVAREARRAGAQDEDPGEDIRVRTVPRAELRALTRRGALRSAVTLGALALAEWAGEE